ncbi:MAG TPA: hypothetical protein VK364_06680, partial [Hymenobacter sp.]|nr:hypothetical protein [Hymenobacter sp.]
MIIQSKLMVMVVAMTVSTCAFSQQAALPPPPPEPEVIDPNARSVDSGMMLDATQLHTFLSEAEAGDGFAAFRLSLHFKSKAIDEQARYWLLYAAARGYPAAQYNLWFELKDGESCKSKLEALAWLRSA